jgi:hypothetical protein
MLDLKTTNPTTNKENLPLTSNPQNKRLTPQLNRMPPKTKRGMWTDEMPEVAMDLIKGGTHSLRKVNKSWDIPMSSIIDHLNGKTKSKKMGSKGVLKKDVVMMKWTLDMQECGLSISLQQLKMKVTKLTQTKDTPFQNEILGNSWWD